MDVIRADKKTSDREQLDAAALQQRPEHQGDDECGCERLDNGECGCLRDRIARGETAG